MKNVKKISIFGFAIVSAFLMLSVVSVAQPLEANSNMEVIDRTNSEIANSKNTLNKIKEDKIISYCINKLSNKASVNDIMNKIASTDSESERIQYYNELGDILSSSKEFKVISQRMNTMFGSDLSQMIILESNDNEPLGIIGAIIIIIFILIELLCAIFFGTIEFGHDVLIAIFNIIQKIFGGIINGVIITLALLGMILKEIFGIGVSSTASSRNGVASTQQYTPQVSVKLV